MYELEWWNRKTSHLCYRAKIQLYDIPIPPLAEKPLPVLMCTGLSNFYFKAAHFEHMDKIEHLLKHTVLNFE